VDQMEAHPAAIQKLFDAAESCGIPLWLESGWAIDARLGRFTRIHDDIDVAYPKEWEIEYRHLIEELGYAGHEFLDYGFLSWRGDLCLDSEACHRMDGAYSFTGFPEGSCPAEKEGIIGGYAVRCVSWEAIYFEMLGYIRDIPKEQWRPKDFDSLRLVTTNLDERTRLRVERLHAAMA
jgi:aminoglycoside 2''-adenylyltransferase